MPELPEIESYRRLAETAVGRTIRSLKAPDGWYLKNGATQTMLRRLLVGHRFTAARRIGKLLLLDTDGGPVVGIRFGMTGTLFVDGASSIEHLLYTPRRVNREWDRFSLGFEDGGSLEVQDPRRLGGVLIDPTLDHLGPDALSITRAQLAAALKGSAAPLKARLLDQSKVAGIGNLIADELLWRTSLSPERPSGSLTPAEVRRLHSGMVRALGLLITRGGSHLGDLMDQRHPGGRCPKDGTELKRATIGGRTTYWCPAHQH
ncbi:MAG TPA: DNA-formamidopyrimidine glycosylase family protein [Acidimicrobiales bacterium]